MMIVKMITMTMLNLLLDRLCLRPISAIASRQLKLNLLHGKPSGNTCRLSIIMVVVIIMLIIIMVVVIIMLIIIMVVVIIMLIIIMVVVMLMLIIILVVLIIMLIIIMVW